MDRWILRALVSGILAVVPAVALTIGESGHDSRSQVATSPPEVDGVDDDGGFEWG